MNEQDIFYEAIEIDDDRRRKEYVIQACGENSDLQMRVFDLLRQFEKDDSFMKNSPAIVAEIRKDQHDICDDETRDLPKSEQAGAIIGPYKLLQKLGEGGMGTVFMAEQKEPVKRRVALKIIKAGMDSRTVLARFEAERQALSMMDHPNIARALDAGTTNNGRPFFVMELVKGVPINKYCDEHRLTPRERLKLFVPICNAVQHAHQKGIVHRDLKPSNILVTEYDEQAVPKVIDFGVAKALHQPLTEKTLFTQIGQVIGTLEYMSPEQAKVNELDVDTRSDIYSLGVVLYELLTGNTPHDRDRLKRAAWDEVIRIIRDEDPPRPSKRVSTSATLPTVAASRKTEPAKLGALMRRELDWIVMRALDKDRNRRFQTCSSFVEDIQHYLNDEPVQSCPPSRSYLFSKFVRKNAAAVASLAAIILTLIAGLASTTWFMLQARQAEARVLRERASTVNQGQQTLLNMYQKTAAMEQKTIAEAQTALAYRRVATKVFNLARDRRDFEPLGNELLETLLEMWTDALASNDRIRQYNRKTFESSGHIARELVSNKRREEYLRAQRADVLARLGRHGEAFDEVLAVNDMAGDSSEFFADLARTCSLCALAATEAGQNESARRYADFGKRLINDAADQTSRQIEAWNKLALLGTQNESRRPSLKWLEDVANDPEYEELGLQTELQELLAKLAVSWPIDKRKSDVNTFSD